MAHSQKETQRTEQQYFTEMKRSSYYTSKEVEYHNTHDDCWVSLLGKVFDLTSLIKEHIHSPLIDPIIKYSGEDISHWFDAKTGDVRTRIDPVTNEVGYYTPLGRFVHVPCPPYEQPFANEKPIASSSKPWWKDDKYMIGQISKKTRTIRIINTLTHHDHLLEVCQEETMNEILARYLQHNSHAASYTWKRMGRVLDMKLTLEENGVEDEDAEFEQLLIRDDFYYPAIHLYFNDDLTVA